MKVLFDFFYFSSFADTKRQILHRTNDIFFFANGKYTSCVTFRKEKEKLFSFQPPTQNHFLSQPNQSTKFIVFNNSPNFFSKTKNKTAIMIYTSGKGFFANKHHILYQKIVHGEKKKFEGKFLSPCEV